MTSERIDVLAVLNTAERSIIGAGSSEFRPAMREAIAAVAELIEKAQKFLALPCRPEREELEEALRRVRGQ